MRNILTPMLWLCLSNLLIAQGISFTQQSVGTSTFNPRDIEAADINGDGAPDALVGAAGEVFWFKNSDGLGTFDPIRKTVGIIFNVNAVFPADLDGDGDLDVLAGTGTSSANSELAWFKNLDGTGDTFSAKITLTTQGDEIKDVYAADFDGDGDMDIVYASYDTDVVAWLRNQDGEGTFSAPQIIVNNANGARFLSVGDPDDDGDMDIFSSCFFPPLTNQYAWYKNTDGNGTFSQLPVAEFDGNNAAGIEVGDLDGDGALDFVGAMYNSDRVYWYRNIDSLGTFSSRITLSNAFDGPFTVRIADLDEDGDNDVVAASENDNKIAYMLNDGTGTFGAAIPVSISLNFLNASFSASKLIATADLDDDGDGDILAISIGDNQVFWFKNTSLLAYSSQVQNPTCFGAANGAIYLYVSGGEPPYTITWDNPLFQGDTLTDLAIGNYSVTISDNGGSQYVNTFELTQPDSLYLILTTTPSDEGQNNGSASVEMTGGTSPYVLTWSGGQIMPTIQNLAPGVYTVTVTDANGCTVVGSATVEVIVSTNNPTENESLRIFPNPASEFVQLDFSRWQKDLKMIEIVDAQGKILRQIQTENLNPSTPIRLPETSAGILWIALRLQNGDTIWGKVVVEK